MTKVSESEQKANKLVMAFDICSSTDILEDLHRTGNVKAWRDLLIKLKEFLLSNSNNYFYNVYNFTGDGWILLFEYDINGAILEKFVSSLCNEYESIYDEKIEPILETTPDVIGIKIGMDRGSITKIVMNKRIEYIGRPINVACRLQVAITKNSVEYNIYRMMITKSLYNHLKNDVKEWKAFEVERTLPNIAGNRKINCMLIDKIKH